MQSKGTIYWLWINSSCGTHQWWLVSWTSRFFIALLRRNAWTWRLGELILRKIGINHIDSDANLLQWFEENGRKDQEGNKSKNAFQRHSSPWEDNDGMKDPSIISSVDYDFCSYPPCTWTVIWRDNLNGQPAKRSKTALHFYLWLIYLQVMSLHPLNTISINYTLRFNQNDDDRLWTVNPLMKES